MYHLPLPIALACCIALATVTNAAAATRTFKPGGVNAFWSNPDNWQEGVAPVDNDDLVFPETAATSTPTINDIPNLRVRSFHVIGKYTLTGQPLFFGEGGMSGQFGANGALKIDILGTVDADTVWDTNSLTLEYNGELRLGGHTLTFSTGLPVSINGVITGTGTIVKQGFLELRLYGSNTYAGQTIINQGTVVANHANALGIGDGTPGNGTFVNNVTQNGASLALSPTITLGNEYIRASGAASFAGALEGRGAATFTGPIELAGDTAVSSLMDGTLTLAGPISGNGRLVIGLINTFVLTNSNNSFTGGLRFGDGSLSTAVLRVMAVNALPGKPPIDVSFGTLVIGANGVEIDSLTGRNPSNVAFLEPNPQPAMLVLSGQGEAVFDGHVTGNGTINIFGSLNQTFTAASNAFTGVVFVQNGTLTLMNPLAAVDTVVDFRGRLALKASGGVAGKIQVRRATLQVGTGAASTVTSGQLDLSPESIFEVSGSLPGALAKLSVTGAVELEDATLSLALPEGFSPTVGQAFTIIENDGADAITGTFEGLPEGATIGARGATFAISYAGGTGNDVVLTVTGFAREYFLSEGATGTFFTTDILIANPNLLQTTFTIAFLKSDGTTVVLNDILPQQSHRTLTVNGVAGMEATSFSTIVTSTTGLPLVVERTMWWDATGYGSHTERAVDGPSRTWLFAEGSQGFFSTYVLLANPQSTANTAFVQYLIEGAASINRAYPLAPSSRFTIDIGADAALVNQSFGMSVVFDQPGIAERAMYFGSNPLWKAGHESAGVTAPSTTWFLAEGATGTFFETFVLLANPNQDPVTATLTFLPATGEKVVRTKTVPGRGRVTVNIEAEDPSLANAAVATSVSAPSPIVVERSQYWPDPAPLWHEAHNSFGVVAPGTKWGLAEGRVGGANNAQTYILLANPGTEPAQVEIRVLRENSKITGGGGVFTVQPGTRYNVPATDLLPALQNENFGAVITSTQPIVVERALYWDAGGVIWAAGSNATATPLPF